MKRPEQYFTGGDLDGLLAENPFKPAIEQSRKAGFPAVYDMLTDCIPPELAQNIITYPWRKHVKTELLREVGYRPGRGELLLFVLTFRRSWNRISERVLVISSRAVYLPKKNSYALTDIYRSYFEEKKGRLYLKNFSTSHVWERAAIHLIEASMLIFGGERYDEEINKYIKSLQKKQAGIGRMSESGMIKRLYAVLQEGDADASRRILTPDHKYGKDKMETLAGQIAGSGVRAGEERPVFAYDLSLAAGGKAGLLFTTAGVHLKDIALAGFIPYGEIKYFEAVKRDFRINGSRVLLGKEEDGYKLKECLRILITYYGCGDRGTAQGEGKRKRFLVHSAPRGILETKRSAERQHLQEVLAEIKDCFAHGLQEENRQRILYADDQRQRLRFDNLRQTLYGKYPRLSEEAVYFAVDTSLAVDGRTGVIAAERGFYFRERGKAGFIDYKHIVSFTRRTGQLYINGQRLYIFGRRDIVLIAGAFMRLILRHNRGFTTNIHELSLDKSKGTVTYRKSQPG